MTDLPVLYLDNWALSKVVCDPNHPGAGDIRALVADGRARIAISFMHVIELSPQFEEAESIRLFLDEHPPLLGLEMNRVFEAEIENACRVALGGSAIPVRPFAQDLAEWASDIRAGTRAVPFLRYFAAHPEERKVYIGEMQKLADQYNAAKNVPDRPHEWSVLRKFLQRRPCVESPSGIMLPKPLPADVVLARCGGLSAFPAYQVAQALAWSHLDDLTTPMTANDLLDQGHALYAPYAAATVLDEKTAVRIHKRRLPCAARVTHKLAAVRRLLDRWSRAAAR